MGNDPREAELIDAAKLGFVAAELEALARTVRQCEEVAKSQENASLAIYYWSSAEAGLKRMTSFVRAADESRRQAQLGKPLQPGQLKPRSTAKKPKIPPDAIAKVKQASEEVKAEDKRKRKN